MSRGITIDIKGLKELRGEIDVLRKAYTEDIQRELKEFAINTVADAKRLCPVNESFLRNSISPVIGKGEVEIVVAADYAAYVEFGTRGFAAAYVATLPPDWQAFAAKYKGGGGGSFDEFIKRLVEWVKKKKIGATYNVQTKKRDRVGKQSAATTAEADAYAIAMHIIRNGTRPQPFIFPAVEKNRKILIDKIKTL